MVAAALIAVVLLGGNGKVEGMADVEHDEPFDAFSGGYPVPPMPGQALPELADVVAGSTETDQAAPAASDDRKDED